jgi:general stress protein 26
VEVVDDELHRRVRKTIWCTLATVDARGRARTRIVHPVWEGDVCWIASRARAPKVAHIERAPGVSLLWWDPDHQQVTVDGTATVHRDEATKRRAWAAFSAPAEPYGWDPATIFPGGPGSDEWVAISVVPERVALFGA